MADTPPISSSVAELRVRQSVGLPVGMTILFSGLIWFSYLAIQNVSRFNTIPLKSALASSIWLTLVCVVVGAIIREFGGVWAVATRIAGCYSLNHFVWIEADNSTSLMSYGFVLFGQRYYLLRVELNGITSVAWHSGQGTQMSGKDCNDWSVSVWFDPRSSHAPRPRRYGPSSDDLEIIGMAGARASVEAFGLTLVAFLRNAGAKFDPSDDGQKFKRPSQWI